MSRRYEQPVEELDLLAFADGRLDRDPIRKQVVEEYLQDHPDVAARVKEYMAQNEAIRVAYSHCVQSPMRDSLLEVLARDEQRPGRWALRAIAAVLVVGLAVGAGVWIGREMTYAPLVAKSFVEETMLSAFQQAPAQGGPTAPGGATVPQPLAWLSQKISLELQPPNLQRFGFRQVDIKGVNTHGMNAANAVQVTYADNRGRTVNLFLRTRWKDSEPALHFSEHEGVSMAYWLDGPLVYGLAARIDRAQLAKLAGHIRSMRGTGTNQPRGVDQAGATVLRDAGQAPGASGAKPSVERAQAIAPSPGQKTAK